MVYDLYLGDKYYTTTFIFVINIEITNCYRNTLCLEYFEQF